ncbi:guanine nucleotide exchange factor [Anaeramoeba flamelloides]|uniref:Guanine nucleotide exchange factor n=1 Tax=Anaeramoeba flamelloides TaxID=1746091 RepID=A0ABQ8YVW1_9EUKA|nr:guanine nucleotide exchange factor [Anaeramoeba flamelloides]
MNYNLGSRVSVFGCQGTIVFHGKTHFSKNVKWYGICLDEPVGRNNGEVDGYSYFSCEENHGLFVRESLLRPAKTIKEQAERERNKTSSNLFQKLIQDGDSEEEAEMIREFESLLYQNEPNVKSDEDLDPDFCYQINENSTYSISASLPFLLKEQLPINMVDTIPLDFEDLAEIRNQLTDHQQLMLKLIDDKERNETHFLILEGFLENLNEYGDPEEMYQKQLDSEFKITRELQNDELDDLTLEINKQIEKESNIQNELEQQCYILHKELIDEETKELQNEIKNDLNDLDIISTKIEELKQSQSKLKKIISSLEIDFKVSKATLEKNKKNYLEKLQEKKNKIKAIEKQKEELYAKFQKKGGFPLESIKKFSNENEKLINEIFKLEFKLSELNSGKSLMKFENEKAIVTYNTNEKEIWKDKLIKFNPYLKNLQERVLPLHRFLKFINTYNTNSIGKKDEYSFTNVTELITQHFKMNNLNSLVEFLKKKTDNYQKYSETIDYLTTTINQSYFKTQKLWDLVIYDPVKLKSKEELNLECEQFAKEFGLHFKIKGDFELWLEPADNKSNIIYNEEEKKKDPTDYAKCLEFANINKIIQLLINGKRDFVTIILNTFPIFLSNEHFVVKMIQASQIRKLEKETQEKFQERRRKIRIKIFSIITRWIRSPNKIEPNILMELMNVIQKLFSKILPKPVNDIRKLIKNKIANKIRDKNKKSISLSKQLEPIIPTNIFSRDLKFTDIHPEEMARQITLVVSKNFQEITLDSLVTCSWKKEPLKHKATAILKMIDFSNNLSQQITETILLPQEKTERMSALNNAINLGTSLLKMNNFDSVVSIISVFFSPSIKRMKDHFKKLSKKAMNDHNKLLQILDNSSTNITLRTTYKQIFNHLIPYLGTYLADIYNLSQIPTLDNNLINFRKLKKISETLQKIHQYQLNSFYNFLPIPQIQHTFLSFTTKYTLKKLYLISLNREPRNKNN